MSINLTTQELQFLKKVGIPTLSIFNVKGLPPSKYRPLMKAKGAVLACGVTPCRAKGHQLRDAHGHCVICNPSCLSHAKRHHTEAFVYVAYSATANLVKVGYSDNIDDRIRQMNLHKLATATDWSICKASRCSDAGHVEAEVHKLLKKFRTETKYGAKEGGSREVFQCGRRTALRALKLTLDESTHAIED